MPFSTPRRRAVTWALLTLALLLALFSIVYQFSEKQEKDDLQQQVSNACGATAGTAPGLNCSSVTSTPPMAPTVTAWQTLPGETVPLPLPGETIQVPGAPVVIPSPTVVQLPGSTNTEVRTTVAPGPTLTESVPVPGPTVTETHVVTAPPVTTTTTVTCTASVLTGEC